ncbi:hypothetical protein SCAPIOD60024 [Staphylococcus capitis]|nr:hypothetical protein SCAPIOD60024 [Staphylococcus capitis]CRN12185.1 hypothetical protein BN151760093 [Staphylococcus capitis]CUT94676.1 hypothetical protein BN1318_150005 [Staphylococcus capitis]
MTTLIHKNLGIQQLSCLSDFEKNKKVYSNYHTKHTNPQSPIK